LFRVVGERNNVPPITETGTELCGEIRAMRREADAHAADASITVAMACLERAGWKDLAADLATIKVKTARRVRGLE
jgi:hypothetical protein